MPESGGEDRRNRGRRGRLIRNIFSYFNRRNLFRKGRRKNEEKYEDQPDWFDREENKNS